jgi:hypothetical protein
MEVLAQSKSAADFRDRNEGKAKESTRNRYPETKLMANNIGISFKADAVN